ncbi:hypothetical protein W97_07616 [Coniosporium apollinis CBS 100218]|uniref:RING-type domain-containing protein n=1 Tax=Coniosporium apollinis (strain CBS 100218) TaxID=1168221 RepID=R7Z2N6_CONA1|nr:uncharacterized protein W97_07616 [Coniosporium apollinis CBS 100218]EON68358.1 hypothetical protein W97_07616 [Coniosporium apollinis CBS 100218]
MSTALASYRAVQGGRATAEFWTKRVEVAPIRTWNAEIPESPDQTEFLKRWFEFHQGYRLVKREDGSEERRAVLGEPWKDVAPGELPRTLDELRTGIREIPDDPSANLQDWLQETMPEPFESIEDTLNALLEESDSDAEDSRPSPEAGSVVIVAEPELDAESSPLIQRSPRQPDVRQRARREVNSNQSGPRQLTVSSNEAAPPQTEQQARHEVARNRLEEARHSRERAALALEEAESEVQARQEEVRRIEREQRTAENYTRVFGTREEIERQGADYESPIGGMFNRAWGRFREAEERRREGVPAPQGDPWSSAAPAHSNPTSTLTPPSNSSLNTAPPQSTATTRYEPEFLTREINRISNEVLDDEMRELLVQRSILQSLRDRLDQIQSSPVQQELQDVPSQGLDGGDRPESKTDQEMTKTVDCKVCYQQIADTAVLPCGHMVMCQWCADVHMPTHEHDRTALKTKKPCPVCRKKVNKRVKIFLA